MRASRSTSSRSEASWPGVGSATPSSSASWPACRTAIGVRSSWATSATRSRRSCSCRSSVSAIWSKAVASSRSSPGAGICPTRAVRSPRPIARVTAISFPTGRVIRPATASPVSSASTAASPAAPAIARKSAVCRVWFAAARPEPVNLTTAVPTGVPRTTTAARPCGLAARSAKPRETATGRPALSRISASAPIRAARSSTGSTSAAAQLSGGPTPCPPPPRSPWSAPRAAGWPGWRRRRRRMPPSARPAGRPRPVPPRRTPAPAAARSRHPGYGIGARSRRQPSAARPSR